MGCRRQKWLWAGGYRESERRNNRYGKAAPKVASGGYKLANSKFGEAKYMRKGYCFKRRRM